MEGKIKIQINPKSKDVVMKRIQLGMDLKDCMHCKFFYGNSRQCIAKKCTREERKKPEQDRSNKCFGCHYRQSENYCFPCMKELLGISSEEYKCAKTILEEKEDG